ncbi:NlpC/P60 family protein [Pelagibacterium halotolerans]|uniref:NLP/P60 family protein n=1 Tax=Pelagibacterium halotolerans (strain DSM 22347 / JCM 15775 / CGMCC 1.7692 / B2) TaxID=1082931 RepID=G4RE16_PELHB|nr:NlpC/P60 family protein [Pelagibacterium halotolerans]AEQ50810.1 NLP/P60 family protein [Pelagibacterium halotolerans B2]QJR19274.1 hypothetical protein HKM20_13000 [Pelagibacterium halotolerans]SDZ96666.1 putative phage cell wall peptidase, NlpC/P60 family [Pelagibacterium halotolerans]
MRPGDEIALMARGWVGTPYRHQASRRGAGADCLGLIRGIWRELYGEEAGPVPAYGSDWRDFRVGDALEAAARRHLVVRGGAPEAGDVVLFKLMRHRPARHCGVMVGPDRFVHAQEHVGVVEVALSESWARRVAGVFGFP